MKIGFVTSLFGSENEMSFGPYPLVRKIIKGIAEKEDVFVVSFGTKSKIDFIEGIKVIRVPLIPKDIFRLRYMSLDFFARKNILKEKPDIINSQDTDAAFLFRQLNRKNSELLKITSVKGLQLAWEEKVPQYRENIMERLSEYAKMRWERMCLDNSDRFVVPSEFEKNEIAEFGIDREKIHVIYNGVDIEKFRPTEKKEDAPVLFFSGGTGIRKGADLVIDAFIELKKDFPELKLIVTGSEDLKKFRTKIAKNNLKFGKDIEAYARIPYSKMPEVINRADIVILPSYHETFGSILAEAMACEKAVVASNSTAIPEIAEGGGILIEPGKLDAFANAIKALLLDDALRKKFGKQGRKIVESKFTVERVIENYLNFFKDVII